MKRLGAMKDIASARGQLERIMKAHMEGNIEGTTFRNLTYAFSIMLSYFKEEELHKDEKGKALPFSSIWRLEPAIR